MKSAMYVAIRSLQRHRERIDNTVVFCSLQPHFMVQCDSKGAFECGIRKNGKPRARPGNGYFRLRFSAFLKDTQKPGVERIYRGFLIFSQTNFFVAGRMSPKNGEGFPKAGFPLNAHLLSGQQSYWPVCTACGIVTIIKCILPSCSIDVTGQSVPLAVS